MSKVVGIDLGTSNSAICVLEGGTPQVIPNREGARTTPSIVAFTRKRETLIGQIAKRQALTNPENTVYGVKRLVGRRFHSDAVEAARRLCPYRIVEAPNGDAHVQLEDSLYSPPEIEAILLRSLKIAAEEYLGEPVEDAIVSVPAYFNDSQRQATRDAGAIAGLEVIRILNEATAAALAYGMSEKKSGLVAVYDLGGGTFDVSILELQDGIYQVVATAGDTYLGGQDFDELIVDWLVEEFRNEHDIDVTHDPMAVQRLKEAAEKAKCELTTQLQTEITLPFLSEDSTGPKHLSIVLTRTRFEQMIRPMLEHTARLCENALRDAGLEATDIAEVIPVGGQTRTPAVLQTMKRIFQKEPDRSVNPDEAVAVGAAIQAGVLQGYVTDLVLLDVTPHTLGIETKDGTFTPLIERNSNLPTKKGRLFTTVFDNQPNVEVHVLQGERLRAEENTSLARFRLGPLSPAPAREPEIEVTFEIDPNGILKVTARDRATGRRQNVSVQAKSGLTRSEVESARIRIDRQFDHNDDTRLLELLFGARIVFDLVQVKLTDEERISAERTIRAAGATRGGPPDGIRNALQALKRLMRKLTRTMPEVAGYTPFGRIPGEEDAMSVTKPLARTRRERIQTPEGTTVSYNQAGSGPPLVLVHGSFSDEVTNWEFVNPILQEQFTSYAIARRGRAETDATVGHSVGDESRDVTALIEAIGEPVFLLGHSYGAHCSLAAAALDPARVRKLVLYEPPWPSLFSPEVLEPLEKLGVYEDWDAFAFTFFRNALHVPLDELEALRASELWPPIVADAKASLEDIRALARYDFDARRFSDLDVPVLLQVGSESPRELYITDALAAVLPDARIEPLPGHAHEGMTTGPEMYAKAVTRFLLS